MKKFLKVSFCLCMAVSITACSSITNYALRDFVDGDKTCKASELRTITRNLMAKNTVKIGEHQDYVTSTDFLGQPDRIATFYMETGSEVEAFFYKTASEACDTAYMSHYSYFPIFMVRQHVVGMGHDFYEKGVKPFLSQGKVSIKVLAFNQY